MTEKKFEQLDGLRFFAVFLVLIEHWGGWFKIYLGPYNPGGKGVDLFFVLSGFLITLGLFKGKERGVKKGTILSKFYIKRSLRIFPIYYLALLVFYVFFRSATQDGLLWYLFYAANFYNIKIGGWRGWSHLWSLSVEEQFYLVWPFVICFLPDKREILFMSLAVIGSFFFGMYFNLSHQPLVAAIHPLSCLQALGMGGILAYFYLFHKDEIRRLFFKPWFVAGIIFQLIIVLYLNRSLMDSPLSNGLVRLSYSIFCAWLIGRAVFGFSGIVGYILELSILRYIGRISYCIYLIHPVVPTLLSLSPKVNYNIIFAINFVITVGIASISWYLIESPILKFKERFE
jgi:peptidoglycan/LPS O-acetylase OafA/YrhL